MGNLSLASVVEKFRKKFSVSGELSAKGRQYIPGGYSRASLTFGPHAIYVESGDGPYLHTVDGHRLLDFHNNFSCTVLGHNHPAITEALKSFASRGFSFGNPMEHERLLAELLCERVASVERVVFSCSASESCLSAVRIARANTGKRKVAKFEGGYHGLGDPFVYSVHPDPIALAGPARRPLPVPNTAGCTDGTRNETIVLPQNDFDACEEILTQSAGEIACLILELQAGAGGVIRLEPEFVKKLRALTSRLGILLIVDETITLRAAYRGMQSDYGISPDLTVMGKIIGGGLPLGAVGGREELFRMNEEHLVYHSGTHHGHPLSTWLGLTCMKVMDEAAYARLNGLGKRIQTDMNEWARCKRIPFSVNGAGSHLGYEISDEPGRVYKSCRDIGAHSNETNMQIFAFEMANRGIFPMYRGQIALSLVMTEKEADQFVAAGKEILADLHDCA